MKKGKKENIEWIPVDPEEFSIHTDQWVDVVVNRDEYDYIYDLPTEEDLDQLKPKDSVKIANCFERFFVRVVEIRRDCVIGIIENHLRGSYDYMFGDKVKFEKRNIFTITKEADRPKKSSKISKNTARMMKMLGKDPLTSSQELKLFESIENQK